MDPMNQAYSKIDSHLQAMKDVHVKDEASALTALTQCMRVVAETNRLLDDDLTKPPSKPDLSGSATARLSIVDKLQKCIEAILVKLRQIVKKLGDGISYSLTVGTSVSLTINFPPGY
jgi:hypothetical protein